MSRVICLMPLKNIMYSDGLYGQPADSHLAALITKWRSGAQTSFVNAGFRCQLLTLGKRGLNGFHAKDPFFVIKRTVSLGGW